MWTGKIGEDCPEVSGEGGRRILGQFGRGRGECEGV